MRRGNVIRQLSCERTARRTAADRGGQGGGSTYDVISHTATGESEIQRETGGRQGR